MTGGYIKPGFKWHGDKIIREMQQNEQALIAVGIQIEETARKLITEYPAVDTGNLRGSITWAIHNKSSPCSASAKSNKGKNPGLTAHGKKNEVWIGTNVFYGPYVELGTSKMGARPYLLRALWESRDRIIKTFQTILGAKFKGFKT